MERPYLTARAALSITLAAICTGCCVPESGDADVQRGMALFDERRYEEAIEHFEVGLEKPLVRYSRSDVLTAMGNCYYEMDQLDTALGCHDQAIAEDPQNERAHVNKGIVYRLQGDYAAAEACYRKAMELAPDYAELHGSMGALAIVQGKHEEAIEHLERSIELNATHPVAHSNLAIAYASVGQFDDADTQLQIATDLGYHQPELIRQQIDEMRAEATGN